MGNNLQTIETPLLIVGCGPAALEIAKVVSGRVLPCLIVCPVDGPMETFPHPYETAVFASDTIPAAVVFIDGTFSDKATTPDAVDTSMLPDFTASAAAIPAAPPPART